MSVHFKKKAVAKQEIPTASMPDIVFMLLIFFMVTTVLREVTIKVQTRLPNAESVQKIEQKRLVAYVYAGPIRQGVGVGEVAVQIDDALVEVPDIRLVMYRKLTEQPRLIVSLRVDESAEMGLVTDIQQELRQAGTFRINYSTKRQLPG
ncbi:MAG TPA: biopolymer transporter ExbD [Rhodothermia bacterium]